MKYDKGLLVEEDLETKEEVEDTVRWELTISLWAGSSRFSFRTTAYTKTKKQLFRTHVAYDKEILSKRLKDNCHGA